nr:helix-hairpin-helix domain-containing protein [uncultured Carboxylicivirga sp.]
MKRTILLMILMSIVLLTNAQDIDDVRKMISDMIEQFAEQQQMDFDYDEMVNDLINLTQNPINLNNTTKEELEKLFFLNDYQIENILFYQYNNGPIMGIYELQAIEDLDQPTIERMLPFVTIGEVIKKQKYYTHYRFLGRLQTWIQTPQGYLSESDSIPPAYAGSKLRWLTKARVDIGDKWIAGFTLEKDPGEVAFPNAPPIADFTSAFLQWNNVNKVIKKLIIGDYRLSFGQGLGIWSDMAFSKSTETGQLRRRSRGLNNYTSVNESSFFRGVASEFSFKKVLLTPFLSYKTIDGSIQSDSIKEEDFIRSIQETGYHRTASEIANRHTIKESIWGIDLQFKHHLFSVDAGYSNWYINKKWQPEQHLKNMYHFSGNSLESAWISPSIFLGKLNLFGEFAFQNFKDWGLYQGLTYKPGSDIITSLAYRKYSNGFTALNNQPFAESSVPGGESGIYASFQFKPIPRWTVKTYADLFEYSWLRYNVYAPSTGFEWFLQLDHQINWQHSFYIRYKSTTKEINSSQSVTYYEISDYTKQSIRIYYDFELNDQWELHTQTEHSFYSGDENSTGWIVLQDIIYTGKRIGASFRYTLFDVDDYNSRIYSYEPDVLYAFTIPSYQYKGAKIIANANVKIMRGLRLWCRLSHVVYRDKESISSGHQEVKGNKLTELKFQVQYLF